jgi:hypothetical protein
MAGPSWNYVLKFIITGTTSPNVMSLYYSYLILRSAGDAGVGKSSLLIRLTDQRFLANPDPTVPFFPSPIVSTSNGSNNQARRRVRLKADHYTRGGQSRQITVYVSTRVVR